MSDLLTSFGVIQTVFNALVGNTDIHAFCNDVYEKNCSFYLGIDENAPPNELNYPLIALTGIFRNGRIDDRSQWNVDMTAGVVNETITADDYKKTTVLQGMLEAEQLITLAVEAVQTEYIVKLSSEGEHSQISYYPLYVSYTTLSLERLKNRRRLNP